DENSWPLALNSRHSSANCSTFRPFIRKVTLRLWRSKRSVIFQIPTPAPDLRSGAQALFCFKTAFGCGRVAPPGGFTGWWVAKFSGQTSHGTMKVAQILALSGHSIGLALPMFFPRFAIFLSDVIAVSEFTRKVGNSLAAV